MSNIKLMAVEKAVSFLNASGASYFIAFDGYTFGDKSHFGDVKPIKLKNSYKDLYKLKVTKMKPGDCSEFAVDEDKAEGLRGAITGTCSKLWGRSSYMTAVRKLGDGTAVVEILRVA